MTQPLLQGSESAEIPDAQVVVFFPRVGLGYRHEKDHLALFTADATLCGISLVPGESSGTHTYRPYDVGANYSCKRCVKALRRRGPVRVHSRISYSDDGRVTIVGTP